VRAFPLELRKQVVMLGRRDSAGPGDPLTFRSQSAALTFLTQLVIDQSCAHILRELLAEETRVASLQNVSDREVLTQLARRIADGQLRLEMFTPPPPRVPVGLELPDSPPPIPPKPEKNVSWLELQVLWADTGVPVPSVSFKITPFGASKKTHRTNSEGIIRLDPIKKGDCLIESDSSGATYSSTITGRPGDIPTAPATPTKAHAEKNPPEYKLVDLRAYKVKTGDTLESVANRVSISWHDLAKFNWGTDDPERINRHLRWDVGCSKKAKDGKNYLFDDSDDPGVIFVPEPWKVTESSGQKVVVLVKKAASVKPWIFSV